MNKYIIEEIKRELKATLQGLIKALPFFFVWFCYIAAIYNLASYLERR